MSKAPNAAALRQPVEILTLKRGRGRRWRWQVLRKTWAAVAYTGKRNLFSAVGIGARGVVLQLRRQELDCFHAIRWQGEHLFITAVTPLGRHAIEAQAAKVTLADCTARPNETQVGDRFPGILTEKYLRYEQETPMSVNTLPHVLVTPKAIRLDAGSLVEIEGVPYPVRVAHVLDDYRNEYEVERMVDL